MVEGERMGVLGELVGSLQYLLHKNSLGDEVVEEGLLLFYGLCSFQVFFHTLLYLFGEILILFFKFL